MKNCPLFRVTLLALSSAMFLPAAQMEFEKELAAETGWRATKWGMSVQDVAQSFGKDFQEEKRSKKETNLKVAIRGKLKTKFSLDGLQYEVKFGFNPADRLNTVVLVCQKAKKESFAEVRQRLTELFGETHAQGRTYTMVGVKVYPYLFERLTWRQGIRQISFQSLEMRPNIFMTIRRFSVGVTAPESEEEDVGAKGTRRFNGEVYQIREPLPGRPCVLEVNPLTQSLKATCRDRKGRKDDIILDHVLTSEDRMQAGAGTSIGDLQVQELKVLINGRSDPVRLSLGADVIAVLRSAFPNHIQ
jgi:hypothetical protein